MHTVYSINHKLKTTQHIQVYDNFETEEYIDNSKHKFKI